jgi:hypothetical protein
MSDVYVYYFTGSETDYKLSSRPATLEAIKGRGEPIMESQIVVDHTEVDGNGFLVSTVGKDSYAVNELSAQIKSLELRATSRDTKLDESLGAPETKDSYMLHMESRELRSQARQLKTDRIRLMADEADNPSNGQATEEFGGNSATG